MRNFNIKSRSVFEYYYHGEITSKLIKKKHRQDISKIRRNLIKKDTYKQMKEYICG